jgi:putative redox protein
MNANVEWRSEQLYTARSESGHTLTFDVAREQGPTPMETVLMSLCGCTAIDVVIILRKKREPFTGLSVSASAQKSETPPNVFTRIEIVYRVSGEVSHKSMEDAVRLSKERYCSVSAMLEKTAEISHRIEYARE